MPKDKDLLNHEEFKREYRAIVRESVNSKDINEQITLAQKMIKLYTDWNEPERVKYWEQNLARLKVQRSKDSTSFHSFNC